MWKMGGYRKRQFFITEKDGARKEAKNLAGKAQTFGFTGEANSWWWHLIGILFYMSRIEPRNISVLLEIQKISVPLWYSWILSLDPSMTKYVYIGPLKRRSI
jgi:hypothetical protein